MAHNVVFDQEFEAMVKRYKRAVRGLPLDQKLTMIEDPTVLEPAPAEAN